MTPRTARLAGIDVGGTFTDFVVWDDGRIRVHKVATTPVDQSAAIVTGLAELGVEDAEIVHGMTVATNALLERSGAKTALLTTAGFADVLVIGRQNRPYLYRLSQSRPASLVADEWRRTVSERLDADGEVVTALDEAAVAALADELAGSDVESLALVFLFSFRDSVHERRAAAIIRSRCPNLPVSLSSEILPEYREYERTATTVVNAYVQPLVARYLGRLATALGAGAPWARVRIMQSNGGAIGLEQAADQAARLVLSGPAGGVVGALAVAQAALDDDAPALITFDMGGTSTDVSLCPGAIPTTAESTITDLPLRLPVIDIHTVGAGGGSVAYLDAAGGLHVGPRSAGAVPGPACYGRGGTEPTVTDANLVLGRLDPEGFLGGHGDVTLDVYAARAVLAELGDRLGLSPEAAALGVIQIANATMERALRRVSVERGHDPRRFTLLPFGGAGPLHACALAEALGIRRILVPLFPGVLSAYGMLVADIVHDGSLSILLPATDLMADPAPLARAQTELSRRVAGVMAREGATEPEMSAALDMRYLGQSYELTVPLELPIGPSALASAVEAFHAAHAQRYGYAMHDAPVECVTLRAAGRAPGAHPPLPPARPGLGYAGAAQVGTRAVWFAGEEPAVAPVYDRSLLTSGNEFAGPAVVRQYDATVVIYPGWSSRVDRLGNLVLMREAAP